MKIQSWLLATSLLLFFGCSQKEEAAPTVESSPNQGPPAALIDGFITSPQRLEQIINATGNLIAYESVEIRPERAGKLVSLDFRESSYVQKNTVIGQVDDSELIAQKERLAVNLELAEKEVARGRELLAIEGISQEELDRLINAVADIKAEQNILDIQINKSKIRAPFSGVMGLRQISQGAYVTPNDVLVDLKQISPIKLEFEVPERFLTQVKEGQTLEFTIVGSDRVFTAKVYAIGTEISPLTRTFKVRASAQNPDNILKPGQFAKVSLVTGTKNDAILIPTDAVIPVLDGKQVYLVRKGRVIAQKVVTNDRSSDMVEIVEGLTIGDTVAVSGLLALSDGVAIRINELRQHAETSTE
jgi:membrane fusion protein (multidrug efflux system)